MLFIDLISGSNSVGRVTAFQAVGREFESRLPLKMYKVYVLKSINHDKYYIGQTKDLGKRLDWHNSSRARWTKRFQPWVLVHSETFQNRSEAIVKERQLKALKNIKQFLDI